MILCVDFFSRVYYWIIFCLFDSNELANDCGFGCHKWFCLDFLNFKGLIINVEFPLNFAVA